MGGGGDAPQETPEAIALRKSQVAQLADVDQQDNYKRKRILSASRGTRAFTGSAISRSAPSNSVPKAATVTPAPAFNAGNFSRNILSRGSIFG